MSLATRDKTVSSMRCSEDFCTNCRGLFTPDTNWQKEFVHQFVPDVNWIHDIVLELKSREQKCNLISACWSALKKKNRITNGRRMSSGKNLCNVNS